MERAQGLAARQFVVSRARLTARAFLVEGDNRIDGRIDLFHTIEMQF